MWPFRSAKEMEGTQLRASDRAVAFRQHTREQMASSTRSQSTLKATTGAQTPRSALQELTSSPGTGVSAPGT